MPLQPFTLDRNFTPQHARHDKVTLRIQHLSISGRHEELENFREYLSVPSSGSPNLDGLHGAIFNRPKSNHGRQMKNTIRSSSQGSSFDAPLPLFGGAYHFSPYHPPTNPDAPIVSLLTLELWANPTRLVRYQDTGTYFPPRRDYANSHGAQMRRGTPPDCAGEFSLDGNDNWTPDTPAFEHLNQRQLWTRHLGVSIEGAVRTIEQDVERAQASVCQADHLDEVTVTPTHPTDRFNLRGVETYWDLQSDAPIQRIADMERLLHTFNELDVTTRHYKMQRGDYSVGNGVGVTVPIRAGVKVKVYAKTNRRIRFEVVHDLAECAIPSHILGTGHDRHTFPSMTGVYDRMAQLRQDAAEIMNDLFGHMRNQKSIPTTSKTALNFLLDVSQIVQDAEICRMLIWVLVSKGYVVSQEPFTAHLQALKRGGILETQPRNRRRAYVVSPAYRFALDALDGNCNFAHLTTRHRSRATSTGLGHV